MKKIAVAMPGKNGDALYALPAARELARRHNAVVDFYTSELCLPIVPLLEAQDCIHAVIIPAGYQIRGADCGVQPWEMPIHPAGYEAIYQLGFRGIPDKSLPCYMAQTAGLPPDVGNQVTYDCVEPLPPQVKVLGKYLVMAPRGVTSFLNLFHRFIDACPLPVVIVGGAGEYIGKGIDCTGLDMLEMAAIIRDSEGFVGIMSAPLVVANGFPVRKCVVHDGKSWDMRHIVTSPLSSYQVHPSPNDVAEMLATFYLTPRVPSDEIVVCIPTLNQYHLTNLLIDSVERGTLPADKYVVVDNGGSYEGHPSPKVEVVRPGKNIGCAPSWNIFMQNYQGIKIICNDDLEFHPDTLEKMVASYREHPEAGIIVPDHGAGNAFSCFIVCSKCWETVGPFDEAFSPAYFEDNDYAYRLKMAGFPVQLVTDCAYIHHGSQTIKAFTADQMAGHHERFNRNREYYIRKWGGMPERETFTIPFNQP